MTFSTAAARLRSLLNLSFAPVAVGFLDAPPAGVPHVSASQPAGCSYWPLAARGDVFYTTAADHLGCPVGAHTHGVTVPPERAPELGQIVGTMLSLQYLAESEIPAIPKRSSFSVAAYAPLDRATFAPDVVIVRGSPRQVMLLSEAARAAGAFDGSVTMGRPACAMLPHAEATGQAVTSLGCIGNRVYTGLADDELYFTLPAARLSAVVDKLDTIVQANVALAQFHGSRRDGSAPA